MPQIEARLAELGLTLPELVAPFATYVPFVRTGNVLHISGQVSTDGQGGIKGTVGQDVDFDTAVRAARVCGMNLLAQMKSALEGDLDRVVRVVKLGGFVQAGPDFYEVPKVINGCSDLMVEVFGDAGRHARSAVGVYKLPLNFAVEVDAVVEVRWSPPKPRMSTGFTGGVQVHGSIADIGSGTWDACAANPAYGSNPFTSYAFLSALEDSGSVGPRTGWAPRHLSAADTGGAPAAVMPLYAKTHSQGEYVFDHGWAGAYQRAGGRYYPKLQGAVPFTPATGPRLLVRPDLDAEAGQRLLGLAAAAVCDQLNASSVHITFTLDTEWELLGELGYLQRQDQQYWWANAGYATFDDFLAALSSGRRKTIRRERREAQAGLEIVALSGSDLREEHWDAFHAFYLDTGSRKWGRPYLNRAFFSLLGERMADRVLLIMARRDGRWIAGALNLIGDEALYGRNWGALEDVPFLHFELCYYQAIEHAIARGLSRVEAGAQGEHKIARGYLPSPVYSAHYIADPLLREPVARYLEEERRAVAAEMAVLEAEYSPFRNG